MTTEEALHEIENRAAMLRHLGDRASLSDAAMERAALAGLAAVCGDIEQLAHRTREALGVDALAEDLAAIALD